MFNLQSYLNNVESKIEPTSRLRESKVEKEVEDVVNDWIKEEKPTLLKDIASTLNKPMQQLHQLLRKSKSLKKVKVKGRTLIVPSDME